MRTQVLKPGLLVSLKTGVRGGVSYKRIELEPEHTTEEGARLARWETVKHVPDPEDFERATQARGKARALVAGVCSHSTFGLLCPMDQERELQAAIASAREVADTHNASSTLTRVEVFVLVGRIAQDDAEAARAISSEVRELLEAMQNGVKLADVDAIRDAASKARALGAMLAPEVGAKVEDAITEARKAAREIARRVEKAGENAGKVVGELKLRAIEDARFAFLDLDAGQDAAPEAPQGRSLDLPDEPVAEYKVTEVVRNLELEV